MKNRYLTILFLTLLSCDDTPCEPTPAPEIWVCTAHISKTTAQDICDNFCPNIMNCGYGYDFTDDVESCKNACEDNLTLKHPTWENYYRCAGSAQCDLIENCNPDRTNPISDLINVHEEIERYCFDIGYDVELFPGRLQ